MARKKIDPIMDSLVNDARELAERGHFERATHVHTLRPGDVIREGKKRHSIIAIEDPCCRTKVHVRTENGTACYDADGEVYV